MLTPSLRPVQPGDTPFLYRIYASRRGEGLAAVNTDEAKKQSFLRMQFEAQCRYYAEWFSYAHFDIVELEDIPIGRFYVDYGLVVIRIVELTLLPEYRGKGYGGKLLRDLLEEAGEADLPVIAHVEQTSPAVRLYSRLGFEEVRMEGHYRLMRWQPAQGAAYGVNVYSLRKELDTAERQRGVG